MSTGKSQSFTEGELRDLIAEGVQQAFVTMGVQADNPIEMQKDFQHLRDWRTSMEAVKKKTLATALTMLITGAAAVVVMGVKAYLGKS